MAPTLKIYLAQDLISFPEVMVLALQTSGGPLFVVLLMLAPPSRELEPAANPGDSLTALDRPAVA